MNTTAYQIHSYADPMLYRVRSCLKKCDPLHCTAGIASIPHRASTLAIDDPHWGERASVTLDVFDGSIRRAEALLADLHRNGYTTRGVSTRLRDIQRSRGILAHALAMQRTDLLVQFRCDLCMSMHELCYDIVTLKRTTRTNSEVTADGSFKPNRVPLVWINGDLYNRSLAPQKCIAERSTV